MKVAAIICEYNPFHNGHKYLIDYAKNNCKADYVIALMSGDFVQRGEPAVISKSIRAQIALECGADLVLLLPIPYATGSADLFATGAVYLLNRLNIVDYLVFGSECGDINVLSTCAKELCEKGAIDSPAIKERMKSGETYAKARAALFPDFEPVLSKSNNVLALEYLMALNRLNSSVTPIAVKRTGSDYNDDKLCKENEYPSATALRAKLFEFYSFSSFSLSSERIENELATYMPKEAIEQLKDACIVSPDMFSDALCYKLLSDADKLDEYTGVSEDLKNRIHSNVSDFSDFAGFCELLKTKNLTYARISRALIHILLNIKGDEKSYKDILPEITHLRILGIKKDSAPILKEINKRTEIKLISKVPDYLDEMNEITKKLFNDELFASTLYDKTVSTKYEVPFSNEYSKKMPVI